MGVLARYAPLLGLTSATPKISLEEGSTPLIYFPRIGEKLGVELWGKFEGCNPTGSFKDRGMVLAVAKAMEEGTRALICASTGNTSASAAAYAAAAGLPCFVLLPAGKVAVGKTAQALMYGATVIGIRGNFDGALSLARRASDEDGFTLVNSVNPWRLRGQRTAAWEICEALESAPDWHALPVGNAGNISACWTGYLEYRRLGRISKMPRMMGFQAAGAAPLVTGLPCPEPETVATAIRIGNPVSSDTARAAVFESEGGFYAVTDEEILSAQRLLASQGGVFAEPASCAPLAGLIKLNSLGRLPRGIRVVMTLTGNGLKDPDTAIKQVNTPIEIENSFDALLRVLKEARGQ